MKSFLDNVYGSTIGKIWQSTSNTSKQSIDETEKPIIFNQPIQRSTSELRIFAISQKPHYSSFKYVVPHLIAKRSQEPISLSIPAQLPHFVVSMTESAQFCSLIGALPQSMISVTSFELTVVDQSINRSISSDSLSQSELDVLLAQLPLNSLIHIKGLVPMFDPLVPRLRHVQISLSLTLSPSTIDTRSYLSLFAFSLSDQSINQLHKTVSNLTEWNDIYWTTLLETWTHTITVNSPSVITTIANVDDNSVLLSVDYDLTSDIKLSLQANMKQSDLSINQSVRPQIKFILTEPLSSHLVDLYKILNEHNMYVTENHLSCNRSINQSVIHPTHHDDNLNFIDLFGRSTCSLAGFSALYSPGDYQHPLLSYPELKRINCQPHLMNGFLLDDMKLSFTLSSVQCCSLAQKTKLTATARATVNQSTNYNNNSISASVSIDPYRDDAVDLVFSGDSINLVRIADILLSRTNKQVKTSSPLLTSITMIDHSIEHALTQFSLYPTSSLPVSAGLANRSINQTSNQSNGRSNKHKCNVVRARYDMTKHLIDAISFDNLWFEHKNDHNSLRLPVFVSRAGPSYETNGTYDNSIKLHLVPFLEYDMSNDVALVSVLSCTSFMRFVGFDHLINNVPLSVRSAIHIFSASVDLFLNPLDRSILSWTGTASCGESMGDKILLSCRSTMNSELDEIVRFRDQSSTPLLIIGPEVVAWMMIKCFHNVDIWSDANVVSAINGRCVDPEINYLICQRDLKDSEGDAFMLSSTTSKLIAIQPHLANGYVEVPTANIQRDMNLSNMSDPHRIVHDHVDCQRLLRLAFEMQDVWFVCLDYLDLNSIFFGLVPALRSGHHVSVDATTCSRYWKNRLICDFGEISDVALFNENMLIQLLADMFQRRRVPYGGHHTYTCDGSLTADELKSIYLQDKWKRSDIYCGDKDITRHPLLLSRSMEEQIDNDMKRTSHYCIHYSAAVEYQCRMNSYAKDVMHQDEHRVMPQRNTNHSTSISFDPISVPRAGAKLILCTPPFTPIEFEYVGCQLAFTEERNYLMSNASSGSHAYELSPFVNFMEYSGNCCGAAVWSLYSGPVYVYDTGRHPLNGINVELPQRYQALDRPIRMIKLSDSNDWPVTYNSVGCDTHSLSLAAPNLHEFFDHHGVNQKIKCIKRYWKAQVYENERQISDEHEVMSDDEEDEEYDIASTDYDWSTFVPKSNQPHLFLPLTNELLEQKLPSMKHSASWTNERKRAVHEHRFL